MENQTFIEYEVIEPISNKSFITESRYEALDYYKQGYIVYETLITKSRPSQFTQTRVYVTLLWNNNPEFEEA